MSPVNAATGTLAGVVAVLAATLGVDDRGLDATTPLFGSMPELDSLGVVELAVALENHFGITVDDEDLTGELFESVGSLAAFVDTQLGRA